MKNIYRRSVRLEKSLFWHLGRISTREGRKLNEQIAFFLEALIPLASTERFYRIVPVHVNLWETREREVEVRLPQKLADRIPDVVDSYGIKEVSRLIRDLLWVAVEYYNTMDLNNLTKEEFSRKVRSELEKKWSRRLEV